MESSPATRTRTPTCTVPGLLVGLTKLFNLTKVCTAPPPPTDDGEAASTTKPGHEPDPGPDPRLVLVRLFDAMSALKSGYVKLQRAHFPSYDPDKVAIFDEAVASELDSVAALQCLYTSRRGIGHLVDERWDQVQRLEAEARRRDADIAALARELRRMQRENARLSRQVVVGRRNDERRRGAGVISVPKELATPAALVRQFMAASRSVADFAELLLRGSGTGTSSLMTAAAAAASSPEQCELIGAADENGEQTLSWRRYSLEAHLWRAMLLVSGDEASFGGDGGGSSFRRIMKPGDALDALMQFPRSGLSSFCRGAYLAAVPADAEAAACGNLDHRAFVSRAGHPRTRHYRAFAAAARSVWALRVLMTAVARCSASEPEQGDGVGVRMFYAGRGSVYASEFMESVPALIGDEEARRVEVDEEEKLTVAFTVTPGVKVGDTVVPCRVLLCRRREREGIDDGELSSAR